MIDDKMTKAYDFGLRFRIGRLLPQVQVTVQACSSRMTTGFTVLILSTIPIQVRSAPKFYHQQQWLSPVACSPAPGRQPPLPSHPPLPSAGGATAR
jgi:hypothetical protein